MLKGMSNLFRSNAASGATLLERSPEPAPSLCVPVDPHDHVLGPEAAAVTLVEYGSYDCPHCLEALAITLRLLHTMNAPGKPGLRLVYRHFPRETPHSRSERAAEAAEAAGNQGHFWEMHEHLLRHHSALGDASLLAYAATLKLNVRTFADALDTHAYQPNVRAQFEGGRESGVHSTPTFFINGVRHDGDWDEETLTAVIERAARLVPA